MLMQWCSQENGKGNLYIQIIIDTMENKFNNKIDLILSSCNIFDIYVQDVKRYDQITSFQE